MKIIKVKYTFETIIEVEVHEGETSENAAEFCRQEEEFKLDGLSSFHYQILD
jgi:hypothetical protein